MEQVLERFNMKNAKLVSTPLTSHLKLSKRNCPIIDEEKKEMTVVPYSSLVESLMYAMFCTRSDIAHVVRVASRFLSDTGKDHWKAMKWILRYMKDSSRMCLYFGGPKPILEGYADAEMAGDLDSKKSTCGFLFTFARGIASSQSKL